MTSFAERSALNWLKEVGIVEDQGISYPRMIPLFVYYNNVNCLDNSAL
jgi:hypothetical protein